MSNPNDPRIKPLSPEQLEAEEQFSAQLRDAERNAVKSAVASGHSATTVFRIIDDAGALAEIVYQDNRHPHARPIMCKKGCSWCCHQTVRITAPEALRIAKFLLHMEDEAARTSAIERLRALDKKTRGLTPQGRAKLHEPCALLKDRSCMVYAVRPLACAGYTSFDVKDCIKGYHAGFMNVSIVSDRRTMHVYDAVRRGMEQGLSEALPESDTADLELTAAVVDALDAGEEAASEWVAGGPVFEKAHLVSDPERDDLSYSSQTRA